MLASQTLSSEKSTGLVSDTFLQCHLGWAGVPQQSFSEIVDQALRIQLAEDEEDPVVFDDRVKEPETSYEALLKDLTKHGRI